MIGGKMTDSPSHWSKRETQPKALLNVPWIVLVVIAVLGVIHAGLWLLGQEWQTWSLYAFSFIPVRLGGGPTIPRPYGSEFWTFVSYALLHADKYHLLFNSLWLLVFSTPVARRLGTQRYLILLAITAAAGAVATLVTHWGEFVITVGASASVSGTMAAAIPIMFAKGFGPHLQSQNEYAALRVLSFMKLFQSPRALVFTFIFFALQLFSGASQMMTGTAFLEERNIAWEAHLGGFVAGLIMFYLLDRTRSSITGKTVIH
jgi:membrane associated rhomboid family serine protease